MCFFSFIKQLGYPDFFHHSFTHYRLFTDIISIYWLYNVARYLFRKTDWVYFLVICMAIVNAWYLEAGMGKLDISWLKYNITSYLHAAQYYYGWLSFIPIEYMRELNIVIHNFNDVIQIGVILIEVLIPIIFIIDKRITILLLFILNAFHLTIFLLSGILFYAWNLMLLCFLFILIKNKEISGKIFKLNYKVVYLVLLISAPFYLKMSSLYWYDSGFFRIYEFYLKHNNNRFQKLDASFFTPYDTNFAQNRFYFIEDKLQISNVAGSTRDTTVVNFVKNYNGSKIIIDSTYSSITQNGVEVFNKQKKEKFFLFLKKFINNKMKHDFKFINYIDAPMHIMLGPNQQNFNFDDIRRDSLFIVSKDIIIEKEMNYKILNSDTLAIDL